MEQKKFYYETVKGVLENFANILTEVRGGRGLVV